MRVPRAAYNSKVRFFTSSHMTFFVGGEARLQRGEGEVPCKACYSHQWQVATPSQTCRLEALNPFDS